MRRNSFVAALVVALSLTLTACGGTEADWAASTSQALDMAPCYDAIATLRAQTLVVQFKSDKDQLGLVRKLDFAKVKLDEAKPLDAVQKLTDYQTQVGSLILGGKIFDSIDGTVTPQMLFDGAGAAIACIQPPVI